MGTRPNISESHSEMRARVALCIVLAAAGTKDGCYSDGSMRATTDFFRTFAAHAATQVKYDNFVPSLHSIPTLARPIEPA